MRYAPPFFSNLGGDETPKFLSRSNPLPELSLGDAEKDVPLDPLGSMVIGSMAKISPTYKWTTLGL